LGKFSKIKKISKKFFFPSSWGSILLKTVRGLMSNLTYPELYDSVEMELKIFQTAAILEVCLKKLNFFNFLGR